MRGFRLVYQRYVLLALSFIVPVQPLLQAIPGLPTIYPYRIVEALILALTIASLGQKKDLPPLIQISFWIGLAGAALSTAFSSKPLLALDTAILEFIVPYCVLYLLVVHSPDRKFLVRCLALFVVGALLVSAVQFWLIISANQAYAHERNIFPEWHLFPRAANFLFYKASIATTMPGGLPFSYGNIDNYASLWVMLIPVLAGAACFSQPRWIFIAAFAGLIYFGMFAYSRGAMLIICLSFFVIIAIALMARCYDRLAALSPVILAIAALAVIHVDANMAAYYSDAMLSFSEKITGAPSGEKITGSAIAADTKDTFSLMQPGASAASGGLRAQALETGLNLARENWLIGIGYGLYPRVEPKFTSPHNLAVQRLVDGGVLSLISFLLFAAYAPIKLLSNNDDLFAASCLIGVSAFMLKATLFGASLSISSNIVWGFGAALCLAASMLEQPQDNSFRTKNFRAINVHSAPMNLARAVAVVIFSLFVISTFMIATIPSCAESSGMISLIGEIWPFTATGCGAPNLGN